MSRTMVIEKIILFCLICHDKFITSLPECIYLVKICNKILSHIINKCYIHLYSLDSEV